MRSDAPALYRLGLSLTRDAQLAEDLVQERFLRAFERGSQFRGTGTPARWLRRILVNLAVDRARGYGRELPVEESRRPGSTVYTVDGQAVLPRADLSGRVRRNVKSGGCRCLSF